MSDVSVSITEEPLDRAYWVSRPYIPIDIRPALQRAGILLVPSEGFREYSGPVFPVCTEEVFHHLRDGATEGVEVEIAVDDKDYAELALHSTVLIVGGFIVSSLLAPLLVNLLSEYIAKRIGPSGKETEIKAVIAVEHGEKTIRIAYQGPAEQFHKTMNEAFTAAISAEHLELPKSAIKEKEYGH